jgi:hypothetical protein
MSQANQPMNSKTLTKLVESTIGMNKASDCTTKPSHIFCPENSCNDGAERGSGTTEASVSSPPNLAEAEVEPSPVLGRKLEQRKTDEGTIQPSHIFRRKPQFTSGKTNQKADVPSPLRKNKPKCVPTKK